jgi:hydroxyacylglutathione hydrolase
MHDSFEFPTPDSPLTLDRFTLGPFETNTYLIRTANACWILDPSFGPEPVIERVRAMGLIPQAVLLTHAHIDHIAGLGIVRKAFPGVPVHLHASEQPWLVDPERNGSTFFGSPLSLAPAECTLTQGDTLSLGPTRWNVLHVPGHSPGSVAFWCQEANLAIAGDALFAGSIGRTDLPGGDHRQLLDAIRAQLYTMPPETKIYPGHGPATTIGREMKSNPFVKA